MKTYQFFAFRDGRHAANGEVQAESPEEAKARKLALQNQPKAGNSAALRPSSGGYRLGPPDDARSSETFLS